MKISSKNFRVREGEDVDLEKWPTIVDPVYKSKKQYEKLLKDHVEQLSVQQQLLYSSDRHAILLIFQAMDAAGKDGAIKHVMSGVKASKVVIFSEWVKMLELVRELAAEMGIECAWHTGSVPQQRRRAEIARFREDSACRLFLSSDAGALGLNLQIASCLVNLDLPWNPAKLEQRIARIWRKGQTKAVTVVNFVTENSIEHSIMHLLGYKQSLADGVLDGAEDFSAIKMPSGKAALIERMQALLGIVNSPPLKILSSAEVLVEELAARLGERLIVTEICGDHVVAVIDADQALLAAERARLVKDNYLPVPELLDRATWEAMQRLANAGVINFSGKAAGLLRRVQPSSDAGIALQAAE